MLQLEPGQQRLFPSLFLSLFHLPRHVQINVTSHRPSVTNQIGSSTRPHATRCQNLCARCRQQWAQVFYYFNTIFCTFSWTEIIQQYIYFYRKQNLPQPSSRLMLDWWDQVSQLCDEVSGKSRRVYQGWGLIIISGSQSVLVAQLVSVVGKAFS
jgi:hypothetical protein